MAWRTARLATMLAFGGLACGRTELILATDTEAGSSGGSLGTGATVVLDTGDFDTGRPTTGLDTGGLDTSGPITTTATFTTGADTIVFDTGFDDVLDTGFEDTGFPGTTTGEPGTSTSDTATTSPTTGSSDTDGGTTSGGSSDGGTTTSGGTTDGGTTSDVTTDGGTTDGGTTSGTTTDGGTTGGDFTCLDAVDCVLDCGGASFSCIGQCNDGLSPQDNAAFNDLETCIIFACLFNGSCGFDFDAPGCVACRIDGQLDPATLACDDEAAACTG